MRGMAIQRQPVFILLIVVALLCICILCGKLESTLPWSMVPLKHVQNLSLAWWSDHLVFETQNNSDPVPPTSAYRPGTHLLQHINDTLTQKLKTLKDSDITDTEKPPVEKVQDVSENDGADKIENKIVVEAKTVTKQPKPKPPEPPKAQGPTDPPYIGDSYMSEVQPPQTDCPGSIRNTVSKTDFGGRYLKDIPVLQWANHVTRERHERLSKYPGAHGWAGVDYNTLAETLTVLNTSANWQMLDDWKRRNSGSPCTRCAVVGNGGILKDSKKGAEIDGHDYVFRTNGAITKGFEQDVGSRTTHYTFSTNTLMNSMRSYAGAGYRGPPVSEETRYIFLPDHDRDYLLMKAAATHTPVARGAERGKDATKYFGKDVSVQKLKMYHPDFIRYLRNRFLRSAALKTKYKNIYRPSTGATMLLAALHTCDKVSAYGFMTPDYQNYSDHYYDKNYHKVAFFINHDLRMEMNLWQQLHQAGLIQLYMHK